MYTYIGYGLYPEKTRAKQQAKAGSFSYKTTNYYK